MIRVRDLTLGQGPIAILRGVSLTIARGETLALIGPSGSGKSSLARALLGLPPSGPYPRWSGEVSLGGLDVLNAPPARLRAFRAGEAGMVGQALANALNPHLTVARHLSETGDDPRLVAAAFNIPGRLLGRLPRDLSGGEIQRVLTALALAKSPRFLVLDEPTAALDPANRDWAAARFREGSEARAQLLVTHDLGLARALAERVAVMRDGALVETGPTDAILSACARPRGCAEPGAEVRKHGAREGGIALRGVGHRIGGAWLFRDVSLRLPAGHCVAILGPSGAGKSTLARLIAGYLPLGQGEIGALDTKAPSPRTALVSQHPHRAMAPHFTVEEVLVEVLLMGATEGRAAEEARMASLLAEVALPTDRAFRARRSADLSGGEAQRLVIARALATRPDCLVADEPTSALDPESRDLVLAALRRAVREHGVALVLVTHDRAVAEALADRILGLAEGRLVAEAG